LLISALISAESPVSENSSPMAVEDCLKEAFPSTTAGLANSMICSCRSLSGQNADTLQWLSENRQGPENRRLPTSQASGLYPDNFKRIVFCIKCSYVGGHCGYSVWILMCWATHYIEERTFSPPTVDRFGLLLF